MSVEKYWPGSMTWDEIVERVRSWSNGPITRDEAYEVMHIAGLLDVFGSREEKKQVDEPICWSCGHSGGEMNQYGKIFIHRTRECYAIAGEDYEELTSEQANARDTKFIGFAKGVWGEVTTLFESLEKEHDISDGCIMCNWTPEKIAQLVEHLIAQRAYDLVEHACEDVAFKQTGSRASVSSTLSSITDLPWAEEPK